MLALEHEMSKVTPCNYCDWIEYDSMSNARLGN